MNTKINLFVVREPGGPDPREAARLCIFPGYETRQMIRWNRHTRHEIGISIDAGRCNKNLTPLRGGDNIALYRSREEALMAYETALIEKIETATAALQRLQRLQSLGIVDGPAKWTCTERFSPWTCYEKGEWWIRQVDSMVYLLYQHGVLVEGSGSFDRLKDAKTYCERVSND